MKTYLIAFAFASLFAALPAQAATGHGMGSTAKYYGFPTQADAVRFANYDERQKMLAEWRGRMCKEYGFACAK